MRTTIRGAFVALIVACACGTPTTAGPVDGDAGGDVADAGSETARIDLAIEVDCPECNGYCGDGVLRGSEQCDDGNRESDDGCNALCQVQQGWTCPTPGMPCQRN